MKKRTFQPEKYGMVICPRCHGPGYIQAPEKQCCQKCGGFGYVRDEAQKEANTSKMVIDWRRVQRWERYLKEC